MNESNKHDFLTLLTGMSTYYKHDLSNMVIDLYWRALLKFDYEAVADACSRHATDPDQGQYMPKIADLIRLLEGSKIDQAAVAWSKVREALSSVGAYQDVVFDDAYTMATIQDMGGWIKLCHWPANDLVFAEQDFRKRYAGFRVRGIDAYDCPKRLIGISNADRAGMGFDLAAPIFVGDPRKCLAIMERGKSGGRIEMRPADKVIGGLIGGIIEKSAADSSTTTAQGSVVAKSSAAGE